MCYRSYHSSSVVCPDAQHQKTTMTSEILSGVQQQEKAIRDDDDDDNGLPLSPTTVVLPMNRCPLSTTIMTTQIGLRGKECMYVI